MSVWCQCSGALRLLSAHGKKLIFSLLVLHLMDLNLSPEGMMLNRWWLGWKWSFKIAQALERHPELAMHSREGSGQPITFSAILVTFWSLFLSAVVQPAYHMAMACTSTLSIVAQ